jgi:hypothetical protein
VQALFAAVGKFGCAGAFTIASIFTSGKDVASSCFIMVSVAYLIHPWPEKHARAIILEKPAICR